MEHFNYVDYSWFCLFGLSHSLPFLDFLQETVLIPTRRNTTDTTDAINTGVWKNILTLAHIYRNCYYTIG